MTIEERRRREQRDREYPWRPIDQAKFEPEGTVVNLRVRIYSGVMDMDEATFFQHEGRWVRIDRHHRLPNDPLEFRPTGQTISKERREAILTQRKHRR